MSLHPICPYVQGHLYDFRIRDVSGKNTVSQRQSLLSKKRAFVAPWRVGFLALCPNHAIGRLHVSIINPKIPLGRFTFLSYL